jgi:hypothetical protein
MTIRMYAKKKNIALTRIEVRLRHVQRAGRDMRDKFERQIALVGDLSLDERRRLLETPNTMVVSPGMDFASGDLRSWAHCRGEQTCYRENAFEAFRDCCSVDPIEDVPAFLLGRDDFCCGELVQVARNTRALLRQAGGDGGDIATAQQDKRRTNVAHERCANRRAEDEGVATGGRSPVHSGL